MTRRLFTPLILLLTLVACDDDGTQNSADVAADTAVTDATTDTSADATDASADTLEDASSSVEADCATFAAAQCAAVERCAALFIDITYGEVSACESAVASGCVRERATTGASEGPADLDACASALGALSCADLLSGVTPDSCAADGSVATGEPCSNSGQCALSEFCAVADESSCGVCAAIPGVGDACVNGECGPDGLYCDDTDTCFAFAELGEPCETATCLPTLSCAGEAGSKTCQDYAGEGEPCDGDEVTAPNCNFLQSLFCDPTNSVCIPITAAESGASCGLTGDALVLCQAGGECDSPPTGTCVGAIPLGEACTQDGPACQAPGACIDGTCAEPAPITCE